MQTTRERLNRERRIKRLRFIRNAVVLLLVLAGLVFLYQVVHRPGFAFGGLAVHGSDKLTVSEILRLSGTSEPVNLFNLSSSKIRDTLKKDVRVADVTTSYSWPLVLNVNITERQGALYLLNGYKGYTKLDPEGLVIDVGSGLKDGTVPVLTGFSCGNVYIGDRVEEPAVGSILALLKGLSTEAKAQITEIKVAADGKVSLGLKYGFPVLMGPVEELADKAELFMTVFNEIKNKQVRAEYIDLQYSKPFIRLKQ